VAGRALGAAPRAGVRLLTPSPLIPPRSSRHTVLTAAHPSPLSASRGFLGCRHFSAANALLAKQGRPPIDWRLPP
jgi:uracil DNA glycosylase